MQWVCIKPKDGVVAARWKKAIAETMETDIPETLWKKANQNVLIEFQTKKCAEASLNDLKQFSSSMFDNLSLADRQFIQTNLTCGKVKKVLEAANLSVILCEPSEKNSIAVFTLKKSGGSCEENISGLVVAYQNKLAAQPKNVKHIVVLEHDEKFPRVADPVRKETISNCYYLLSKKLQEWDVEVPIETELEGEKSVFQLVCECKDEAEEIITQIGPTFPMRLPSASGKAEIYTMSMKYLEVRPVVFDDIFLGIDEAAEKSHQVDCVRDKVATMMLGVTQSGKTTTLAYAIGLPMEQVIHANVPCISAVDPTRGEVSFVSDRDCDMYLCDIARPSRLDWTAVPVPEGFQLAYVNTLPQVLGKGFNPFEVAGKRQNESTTKDIFAFTCDADGEKMIIVDTPGTKDSGGLRIDVCNAFLKQKLFQSVSKMKVVVTVQHSWFNNAAEMLYQALETITPYFTNFAVDCRNIGVVITHVGHDQKEIADRMKGMLQTAASCLTVCKSNDAKRFLEHIIENLQNDDMSKRRVWAVDPLVKDGGRACRVFIKNLPEMPAASFRAPLPPDGIRFLRGCVGTQSKSFGEAIDKEAYDEGDLIKKKVEEAQKRLSDASINYSYFPYQDWDIPRELEQMNIKVQFKGNVFADAFINQLHNKATENASQEMQSLTVLHATFGSLVQDPKIVMERGRAAVVHDVSQLDWVTMPPKDIKSWESVRNSIVLAEKLMLLCGGGNTGAIDHADAALENSFVLETGLADEGFADELEQMLLKYMEGTSMLNDMSPRDTNRAALRASRFNAHKTKVIANLSAASSEVARYFVDELGKASQADHEDLKIEQIIANLEKITRNTLIIRELSNGEGDEDAFRNVLMKPVDDALGAVKDPAKNIVNNTASEIVTKMEKFICVAGKVQRLQSKSSGLDSIRSQIRAVLRLEVDHRCKSLEALLRTSKGDKQNQQQQLVDDDIPAGSTVSSVINDIFKFLAGVDVLHSSSEDQGTAALELVRPLRIVRQWSRELSQGVHSVKKADANILSVLADLKRYHNCSTGLHGCVALLDAKSSDAKFIQAPFESCLKLSTELRDIKKKVTESAAQLNTELTKIVANLPAELTISMSDETREVNIQPLHEFTISVQQIGQLVGPLSFLEKSTTEAISNKLFAITKSFKEFYKKAVEINNFFDTRTNHHFAARYIEFLAVKMRNVEEVKVEQLPFFEAIKKLSPDAFANEQNEHLSPKLADFLVKITDCQTQEKNLARSLRVVRETMRGLRMYATDNKTYFDELVKREEELKKAIARRQAMLQDELAQQSSSCTTERWKRLLESFASDELQAAKEEMADVASAAGREGISTLALHWKMASQKPEAIDEAVNRLQFATSVLNAIIDYVPAQDQSSQSQYSAVEEYKEKLSSIVSRFQAFATDQQNEIQKMVKRGHFDRAADATTNFQTTVNRIHTSALGDSFSAVDYIKDVISSFTNEIHCLLERESRTEEEFENLAIVIVFCDKSNIITDGVRGEILNSAKARLNARRSQQITEHKELVLYQQVRECLEKIDRLIRTGLQSVSMGRDCPLDFTLWETLNELKKRHGGKFPDDCEKEVHKFCERLLQLSPTPCNDARGKCSAEDILLLEVLREFERVCDSVKPKCDIQQNIIDKYCTQLQTNLKEAEKNSTDQEKWPSIISTLENVAGWLQETRSIKEQNNTPLCQVLCITMRAFEQQLLRGIHLAWKKEEKSWKILCEGLLAFGSYKPVRTKLSEHRGMVTVPPESDKMLANLKDAFKDLRWAEADFVTRQLEEVRKIYKNYETVKGVLNLKDGDFEALEKESRAFIEVKQEKDAAEASIRELVDWNKIAAADMPFMKWSQLLDANMQILQKKLVLELSKTEHLGETLNSCDRIALDKIKRLSRDAIEKCLQSIEIRQEKTIRECCFYVQIIKHMSKYTQQKAEIEQLLREVKNQIRRVIEDDLRNIDEDFTSKNSDLANARNFAGVAVALSTMLGDSAAAELRSIVESSWLKERHTYLISFIEAVFSTPNDKKRFRVKDLDRLHNIEVILKILNPLSEPVCDQYRNLGNELLASITTFIASEQNVLELVGHIAVGISPPTEASQPFVDAIVTRGRKLLKDVDEPAAFNTLVVLGEKLVPLKDLFPDLTKEISDTLKKKGLDKEKRLVAAFGNVTSTLIDVTVVENLFSSLILLKQTPSLIKQLDKAVKTAIKNLFESFFTQLLAVRSDLRRSIFPAKLSDLLRALQIVGQNAKAVMNDSYLKKSFEDGIAEAPWCDRESKPPCFDADLSDIRLHLVNSFTELLQQAKIVLRKEISAAYFEELLLEFVKTLSLVAESRKAGVVTKECFDDIDKLVRGIADNIVEILKKEIAATNLFMNNNQKGNDATILHSGALQFKEIAATHFSHSVAQKQEIEQTLAVSLSGILVALVPVCQKVLDDAGSAIQALPKDETRIKRISSILCSIRSRGAYFLPATSMVESTVSSLVDTLCLKDEEMKILYDELQREPGGDGIAIVSLPIFASCELAVLNNYCKDQLTPEAILVTDKRVTLYDNATPEMITRLQELLQNQLKKREELLAKYSKCNDLSRSIKDLYKDILALATQVKQKSIVGDLVDLIVLTSFSFTWFKEGAGYLKHKNAHYLPALHCIQMAVLFLYFECETSEKTSSSSFLLWLDNASKNRIQKKADSKNHLIEVLTGEGKSIMLAVCAAVFALLGHEVDIVCFSRILTARDAQENDFFFKQLNLSSPDYNSSKVRYLTFDDVMECRVGKLRGAALATVMNTQETFVRPQSTRRILLLDETDTVLGPNFFGVDYDSRARLHHTAIAELIRFVYANRRSKPVLASIEKSDPFLKVCSLFGQKGWDCMELESVVIHAVRQMVVDVNDFGRPKNVPGVNASANKFENYFVSKTEGIGYTRGDGIVSYHSSLGYRTAFAYLAEVEANRVTPSENLNKHHLSILLTLAAFPYSTLPSEAYYACFGVSGTLSTLSGDECTALNELCNFRKVSHTKSIYKRDPGAAPVMEHNNFAFHNSLSEWGVAIARIIDDRRTLTKGGNNKGYPVIVVFQTKEDMEGFLSTAGKDFARDCQRLTPETPQAEAASIVKNATMKGRVTMMTRDFGRGLDFKCRNCEKLTVVQAFFTINLSEEVQIRGRTARQGQPGQFFMHFLIDQAHQELVVDKVGLTVATVKEHFNKRVVDNTAGQEKYELLTELRNAKVSSNVAKKQADLNSALERSKKSMALVHEVLDFSRSRPDRLRSIMQPVNANNGVRHSIIYLVDSSEEMSRHRDASSITSMFVNAINSAFNTRWGNTRLRVVGKTMIARHDQLLDICNRAYDITSVIAFNDKYSIVQKPVILKQANISYALDQITGSGSMSSSEALKALNKVIEDISTDDFFARTEHHIVMLTFGLDADEGDDAKIGKTALALKDKNIKHFSLIQIGENSVVPMSLKQSLVSTAGIELLTTISQDTEAALTIAMAAQNKSFSLAV